LELYARHLPQYEQATKVPAMQRTFMEAGSLYEGHPSRRSYRNESRLSIDAPNANGYSPLHLGFYHPQIIRMLLDAGADAHAKDESAALGLAEEGLMPHFLAIAEYVADMKKPHSATRVARSRALLGSIKLLLQATAAPGGLPMSDSHLDYVSEVANDAYKHKKKNPLTPLLKSWLKIHRDSQRNPNDPPWRPKTCVDLHSLCYGWANRGECEANANYMQATCARSCKTCDTQRVEDFLKKDEL
jgi:hypothetical protein